MIAGGDWEIKMGSSTTIAVKNKIHFFVRKFPIHFYGNEEHIRLTTGGSSGSAGAGGAGINTVSDAGVNTVSDAGGAAMNTGSGTIAKIHNN